MTLPTLPARGDTCPPAIELERAATGEDVPAVVAHLPGCQTCRAYVEKLQAETQAFVKARPPERFVTQLRRPNRRPVVFIGVALAAAVIGAALKRAGVDFNVSLVFGGQIQGEGMRLFQVYSAGNFIESTAETPYFQVGESKYGKPVLDRVLTPETPLDEAAKCALVSMDSTLKSNLSVGLPMDLVVYEADRFTTEKIVCIDEQNPYFRMLHDSWGQKLRAVFDSIEDPAWDGGSTDAPILLNPARSKPLKKITNFRDKLI